MSCNHVYNQFIFIDDHAENLKNFEQTARNMQSLSRYSRANQVNKEWIDEYLNEAHSKGLILSLIHIFIAHRLAYTGSLYRVAHLFALVIDSGIDNALIGFAVYLALDSVSYTHLDVYKRQLVATHHPVEVPRVFQGVGGEADFFQVLPVDF